jgi:hypothetical protein
MKKTIKTTLKTAIAVLFLLPVAGLFSCDDMLKTDTEHYLPTEGHELNSPNDTIYSMVGILRKVQEIADRYVLVGELRADLMDITENAGRDLQAIHHFDFDMTDGNPYLDTKAYYDIINNCNFFIKRADTAAVVSGQKVMIKEWAAVQSIRAWVYMQLILNYGKACYYEDPILTVEDMNKIKNDPTAWISGLNDLLNRVQETLLQTKDIQKSLGNPAYKGLSYENQVFIPATLVLGDLYLYTGNAVSAAVQYHDYLTFYDCHINSRAYFVRDLEGMSTTVWFNRESENISVIYTTTESEVGSYLMGWCYPTEWSTQLDVNCTYQLKPSTAAMNLWGEQDYALMLQDAALQDEPTYIKGDLRGTYKTNGNYNTYTEYATPPYLSYYQSYFHYETSESDSIPFIAKYGNLNGIDYVNISYIYRAGQVFLRYAEALNRMGKSTLAFAILKYGVSNGIFNDPSKVKPEEVNPLPAYCNFPERIYPVYPIRLSERSIMLGIHSRGSGEADRNAFYIIPAGVDTVRFVDEKICDEMAMENAFEGNRFHDLMRFAGYYGNEFLATRIANRRGVEDAALKAKLMNEKNWYLPHN